MISCWWLYSFHQIQASMHYQPATYIDNTVETCWTSTTEVVAQFFECLCVYIYVCMCMCVCARTGVYTRMCVHMYTWTYVCVYMCVCPCTCMCVCVSVCTHVCVCSLTWPDTTTKENQFGHVTLVCVYVCVCLCLSSVKLQLLSKCNTGS